MAVTVGTDSYLTLAEFKAQADSLARDYSSFTDEQINAALVESSLFYIDPSFEFKGSKLDEAQAMDLPTNLVSISDISKGAFQAAWQALNSELFVNPAATANGEVTRERKKLATLEKEIEYREGSTPTYIYDTTRIRLLLKPYIINQGGGFMVNKGFS
jgi:hypothetical protein